MANLQLFRSVRELDLSPEDPALEDWIPEQPGRQRLRTLLSPMDVDDFLASSYQSRHVHIRGPADKFASLVSWEDVDWILSSQRVWPSKISLYRNGNELPFGCLTDPLDPYDAKKHRPPPVVWVNGPKLHTTMGPGGTLVIRGAEEIHRPLRCLAHDIERELGEPVSIFLFASGGLEPGVPAHWDAWDSIAIQVAGVKRWSVLGESRRFPLREDVEKSVKPCTTLATLDLHAGDLLYLPRGHWHEVQSLGEPSLHLTINVRTVLVDDFLEWLAKRLRRSQTARAPLPPARANDTRAVYAKTLSHDFFGEITGEALLRYRLERAWFESPRAAVDLRIGGWSQIERGHLPSLVLHSTARFGFAVVKADNGLRVRCNGREWVFDEALHSPLRQLGTAGRVAIGAIVAALRAAGTDEADIDETVNGLVADLVQTGFATVEDA